jgi:hypothetical protein
MSASETITNRDIYAGRSSTESGFGTMDLDLGHQVYPMRSRAAGSTLHFIARFTGLLIDWRIQRTSLKQISLSTIQRNSYRPG